MCSLSHMPTCWLITLSVVIYVYCFYYSQIIYITVTMIHLQKRKIICVILIFEVEENNLWNVQSLVRSRNHINKFQRIHWIISTLEILNYLNKFVLMTLVILKCFQFLKYSRKTSECAASPRVKFHLMIRANIGNWLILKMKKHTTSSCLTLVVFLKIWA